MSAAAVQPALVFNPADQTNGQPEGGVATHMPVVLHMPPLHAVPEARKPLAGHVATMPLQTSAGSQESALARQVVEAPRRTSAGQAAVLPLQDSAASHTPALALH